MNYKVLFSGRPTCMNFQEVTDFPPRDLSSVDFSIQPGEAAFDRVGCGVANVTRSLFQGEEGELLLGERCTHMVFPLKR